MPNKVYVLSKFQENPYPDAVVVDTTSKGGKWAGLSPFLLNAERYGAKNFENLWQFSKVYPQHVSETLVWGRMYDYDITEKWEKWSQEGFANPRAVRYPMGKGKKPLFSYWNGMKLDYIAARKTIYIPIYAELVQLTESFKELKHLHNQFDVALRDYDGYDYEKLGMTLKDVSVCETRKCGHAFILAALLLGKLEEML